MNFQRNTKNKKQSEGAGAGLFKHFNKAHIEGKHDPRKPINHVGNFNDPEKSYKSLRESGTGSTSRAYGTHPTVVQQKVVVPDVDYWGSGRLNRGQQGTSAMMVSAEKSGKKVWPQHLDGTVKAINDNGKTKYEHTHRNEKKLYSVCSQSTSARYEPKYASREPDKLGVGPSGSMLQSRSNPPSPHPPPFLRTSSSSNFK